MRGAVAYGIKPLLSYIYTLFFSSRAMVRGDIPYATVPFLYRLPTEGQNNEQKSDIRNYK